MLRFTFFGDEGVANERVEQTVGGFGLLRWPSQIDVTVHVICLTVPTSLKIINENKKLFATLHAINCSHRNYFTEALHKAVTSNCGTRSKLVQHSYFSDFSDFSYQHFGMRDLFGHAHLEKGLAPDRNRPRADWCGKGEKASDVPANTMCCAMFPSTCFCGDAEKTHTKCPFHRNRISC